VNIERTVSPTDADLIFCYGSPSLDDGMTEVPYLGSGASSFRWMVSQYRWWISNHGCRISDPAEFGWI